MQNLIELSFLDSAAPSEVSQLSPEELHSLEEQLDEMTEGLKKRRAALDAGVNLRFAQKAQDKLKEDGRDTGTIRFADGSCIIIAEIPKRVVWDQVRLSSVLDKVPADVRDQVVKTSISVDERKYLSLPEEIQSLFNSARQVLSGKAKFEIKI